MYQQTTSQRGGGRRSKKKKKNKIKSRETVRAYQSGRVRRLEGRMDGRSRLASNCYGIFAEMKLTRLGKASVVEWKETKGKSAKKHVYRQLVRAPV